MKTANKIIKRLLGAFALSLLFWNGVHAQRINLDGKLDAGELTLYPTVEDGSTYYFLPNKVGLALHEDGSPKFSFTKYVFDEDSEGGVNTLSESNAAGGIIHAVFHLKVSEEQLSEAERDLRRKDGDGKIAGSLSFVQGKVSLISSVANQMEA